MTNKELYKQICATNDNIRVFSQPWWMDVVSHHWDVAIARKGDHITGTWAYPIEKRLGVTLIRTPRLTPYMGPQVFFPHDLKESKEDNFEYDTIAELFKHIIKAPVWNLAMPPGLKQAGIFKTNDLASIVQQTFLIELHEPEEEIFANLKDTMRRNIRMAEDEVVVTNSPEHLKDLYHYQKATLSKKGKHMAFTLRDMQHIMKACLANNAGALWVAKGKNDKRIHAIVWQVWDKKNSYYFMGGQNPESNNYRPMSLLLWHTITQAKKMGIAKFDLEGSMDEGVERFFRNFGGDRNLYIILRKNKSMLWRLKEMILK